ncbi:MAG: sigma-70 family RNA polymerase sigma factor [Thermoflexales bacterium]|nr:sigma-70 family RNA polymerase sigma factor [Thermoflexales bacterium]
MAVSTQDLVQRCQQGQAGAFEALYNRYKDCVYRLALSMTSSNVDAEEVVQDTFTELLRTLRGYNARGAERFEAWLYRAAVRRIKARLRRKRPGAKAAGGGNGHGESGQDGSQALWETISALPDMHREMLFLRYQADLSYSEIALVLDLNPAVVKSRLFQAHKQLEGLVG